MVPGPPGGTPLGCEGWGIITSFKQALVDINLEKNSSEVFPKIKIWFPKIVPVKKIIKNYKKL